MGKKLPQAATVLDIGCGSGIPITKALLEEGLSVYGVDASQTMVETFQRNFPNLPVTCEAVEESSFFNRRFDAVIAWGLLFLLPAKAQENVIQKVVNALQPDGQFLFTAPSQAVAWRDVLTGEVSVSLGSEGYKNTLAASGLTLLEEFEDEGGNHYYHAVKC